MKNYSSYTGRQFKLAVSLFTGLLSISLLVLLLSVILTQQGCMNRPYVRIERLPELHTTGDAWTTRDIIRKVEDLFIARGYPPPNVEADDRVYAIVEHESMLDLIDYTRRFQMSFGQTSMNPSILTWTREQFDCDNFANLMASVAHLAGLKAGRHGAGQLMVGVIHVRQLEDFGGVLGSPNSAHALNFFCSEEGIFVFEPQGTGNRSHSGQIKIVDALDYPNAKGVYKISFR